MKFYNIFLSKGLKNASSMAIGNLVAQAITFIGFIYIARLLGPGEYGIYVTVGAFVGLFQILLLRGFDKTVIREGSKDLSSMDSILENAIGLRTLFILIALCCCAISSFFAPYELRVKIYILLFSFDLFYVGMQGFLGTIYQASEKMHFLALWGIINRLLFISASVACLYYGYGVFALFIIAIIANLSTLAINYGFSRRIIKFKLLSKINIDKVILKQAFIFSLLSFLHFFVLRVDTLMISFLGTPDDVGIYNVANRISQQGEMLRNVVATAFFPVFIKRFKEGSMKNSNLIKYSLSLLAVMSFFSMVVSFFSEDLVTTFFGAEYAVSGKILSVLIFYLVMRWASLPFTISLQATYNEKYLIPSVLIAGLVNIPLNYIFFSKFGAIGVAYSTLIVVTVETLTYFLFCQKVMQKQGFLVKT